MNKYRCKRERCCRLWKKTKSLVNTVCPVIFLPSHLSHHGYKWRVLCAHLQFPALAVMSYMIQPSHLFHLSLKWWLFTCFSCLSCPAMLFYAFIRPTAYVDMFYKCIFSCHCCVCQFYCRELSNIITSKIQSEFLVEKNVSSVQV